MEERIDNETVQQIDLISMLKDIGREWLTILLLAIAAALFADIWICATYQPEYRTSTTFVVTAKGMNNNMGIRTKKYGIADVLNKKTDLKSVMLRYGEYELDILPGKEMVKNPTELIGNGYLERLLKVLRKNYDYVIVDTPPCGMLSDASAIARMTDGAVMVVRQDSARIDRILNGVENIADTGVNLIGYVLNGTEMGITGYGYGYGYGYGHYGYYGKKG